MSDMKICVLIALLATSANASAQIYRWVDAQGRVNFSNSAPPQGVQATVVDANAREAPASSSTDDQDCHTIRCQGMRLEERQRRRDAEEAKMSAARVAAAPKPARGLEFRKYISLQQGMTEGELLGIAGEPDLMADRGIAISAPTTVPVNRNFSTAAREGLVMKTYTYLPTAGDPFTTTITLVGGRISEMDRVRKF
jgi:Domain of unknown function (DUF4124)